MKNHSRAKEEFNRKLAELQKEIQPALNGNQLKEIVIYEKMLEVQEQINRLADKIDRK